MKKLTILTSVLALAACGGGSGGSGSSTISNNPNTQMTFGNIELPTSRVSSAATTSNSAVTGMDSSVTNIAEMTATVESIIGSDKLNELANNLTSISSSSSTNRSASARRSVLRTLPGFSNKEKAANYVMTFTDDIMNELALLQNDEILQTLSKVSSFMRDILFQMLCRFSGHCGTNYSLEDLADMIKEQTTQNDWHDFNEQNQYREFTLKDADFTMSSASNGDEDGALDIVRFDVDENAKITGVKFITLDSDEIGHEDTQNTEDDAYFTRSSDNSNVFNFVQYNEEGGKPTRLEGITTIETYGEETGNRYSDFGLFIVSANKYVNDELKEQQENREPFAGGYNDKKIVDLPSESMNFTGKAIGGIQGKDDDVDLQVETVATLAFNGSTQNQTLSMNFDNWYNVTVDKNLNSDQLKFTFDGTVADDNYALNGMGTGHKEVVIENPGNYNGTGYDNSSLTNGKLQINYYGDNGNPEEFVGVTQYVETIQPANELSNGSDVRMNVSFGGVRDNQ